MGSDVSPSLDPLQSAGSLFKGFRTGLVRMALFEEVVASVPPETQTLLQEPPGFSWVDSVHLDAIITAVDAMRGREGVRTFMHHVSREGVGPVLMPVLRTVFALLSLSPSAVLKHMDMVTRPQFKGLRFQYRELSSTEGVLRISHARPVMSLSWWVWACSLDFTFELCKVHGEVTGTRVEPDGATGELDIRWSALPPAS